MGEDICKQYICEGINIQNAQKFIRLNKQSIFKLGRRPE